MEGLQINNEFSLSIDEFLLGGGRPIGGTMLDQNEIMEPPDHGGYLIIKDKNNIMSLSKINGNK